MAVISFMIEAFDDQNSPQKLKKHSSLFIFTTIGAEKRILRLTSDETLMSPNRLLKQQRRRGTGLRLGRSVLMIAIAFFSCSDKRASLPDRNLHFL
jgi:hypothetical protein